MIGKELRLIIATVACLAMLSVTATAEEGCKIFDDVEGKFMLGDIVLGSNALDLMSDPEKEECRHGFGGEDCFLERDGIHYVIAPSGNDWGTTDTLSYEESSPRAFGIPDAAGVPIFSFRDAEGFKAHPDYSAGKKGDINAAIRFVSDMVEPAQIREANDRFGPNVIYVPLHAEETNGRNKIPVALASLYAEATGATVDMSITQTNVVGHTGARPLERLIARPLFSGEVEPGRKYVLVDDVSVLGGMLLM